MKALIVEDSPVIQESLRHFLADSGVEADYVGDAEEALVRIGRSRPDAVILDHFLPGMDGLELLHELRREERWRSLPVVFLTAAAGPVVQEIEAQLPALAPCRLLRKPADPPAILEALRKVRGGET